MITDSFDRLATETAHDHEMEPSGEKRLFGGLVEP
jgi:hypothetical protein